MSLRDGIRKDGTIEGCVIETHYYPLEYVDVRGDHVRVRTPREPAESERF